jgi:hypothetical protein
VGRVVLLRASLATTTRLCEDGGWGS